jgi:hypothetical protein
MLKAVLIFLGGVITLPVLFVVAALGFHYLDTSKVKEPVLTSHTVGCPKSLMEDMSVGYCVPVKSNIKVSHPKEVITKFNDLERSQLQRDALIGDKVAQRRLSQKYRSGKNKKPKLAFYWMRQAALNGDRRAQYSVGSMLSNGEGVAEDDKESMRWLKVAAVGGHQRAQLIFGKVLLTGKGIKKDRKEAMKWLNLAMDKNRRKKRRSSPLQTANIHNI